jgi:hypothetical protein
MADSRRTTVTASRTALDCLEWEAERRGTSLSALVAEAIEEKAQSLQANRPRPRLGVDASPIENPGARVLTAEPIAEDYR